MNSENIDFVIYQDTDSCYVSCVSFLSENATNDEKIKQCTKISKEMESDLNDFYSTLAKRMFYCDTHRFVIKGEAVSQTAFWTTKKRYVMYKVYDLESNIKFNKPKFIPKGVEVVRSQTPPAYRGFLEKILIAILEKIPKSEMDKMIMDFRLSMNNLKFMDLARVTALNNINEYDDKTQKGFLNYPKGAPAHVKASIAYNRWVRQKKLERKYELFSDGSRVRWCYLKQNPLQLDMIALRGYDDPPELVEFAEKYLDRSESYASELENKLKDYFKALGWGLLPTSTNQMASKFFDFN